MSPSEICGRTSSIGTWGASWSRTVAACLASALGDVGADQQFGIQLFERLAQVAHRGDPGAVHGFARLAHQAVDEFGRLTLRRKNDERNGGIVRQVRLPRETQRDARRAFKQARRV